MSSKVSCGFKLKNFLNSFNEPRFQALDCCIPSTVIAFRQVGMLFGPKAPMHGQRISDRFRDSMEVIPAVSSIALVNISTSSSSGSLPSASLLRSANGRF